MNAPNDGGPAFPVQCEWGPNGPERGVQTGNSSGWHMGLSLRDYFASKAMQGLCAMVATGQHTINDNRDMAIQAYAMADALLRAREVPRG